MKRTHSNVIPHGQARDVKPWRLPFWTEKPIWSSDRIDENIHRRSRVKVIEPDAPVAAAATAAKPASESPELTVNQEAPLQEVPLEEKPVLPSVEELETIRRQAYSEGLEQGIIEGRQQGHKEGYDAGYQEGQNQGLEAGTNEGYQAGFSQGESAGKNAAQTDIDAVVQHLQQVVANLESTISERDQQLPQVLVAMVQGICQQVVGSQLASGAVNIHDFVQQALQKIPEGEQHIKVFVSPNDAKHLAASLDASGAQLNYQIDDTLTAGNCRVESEHSLAEYSVTEHLAQVLAELEQQMLDAAKANTSSAEPEDPIDNGEQHEPESE